MEYILFIISWFLRTFLAAKGPTAGIGNTIGLFKSPLIEISTIILWIFLLIFSLYRFYLYHGIIGVIIAVITFFFVLPSLVGTFYRPKQY